MSGFRAFLGKEFQEIFRTWRIWVLPGIVLFFAVTGPALARFTPQLLQAVAPETGLVIQIPDPTFRDAYLQWTKNLEQITMFAVIIICAGAVSAERRSGTAVLVLTKPLTRTAFIVAKCLSHGALLVGTATVGTALTWAFTYAAFGEAPPGFPRGGDRGMARRGADDPRNHGFPVFSRGLAGRSDRPRVGGLRAPLRCRALGSG